MAKPDTAKVGFLDRLIQQTIADKRSLGKEDDPARERWPNLWEWLTKTTAGSNHVKDPATLTIRVGPEGALASLNDRSLGYALDVACPHLVDVLDAVERELASPDPAIRVLGKGEPKVRKRKSGI